MGYIAMKKMLSKFAILLLVSMTVLPLTLAPSVANAAAITSMGEAINQAGRQRMLTQRMLKNYVLVGLNVRGRKSEDQLKAAISLFEEQLQNLEVYITNPQTKALLDDVGRLWTPVKMLYSQTPSAEKALDLRTQNDVLLAACHQVVLALEEQSDTKTGRLVNVAGRQRMLSQRLASTYALMAWGFEANVKPAYEQAYQQFGDALTELSANPTNTPEIIEALKVVRTQFKRFERTANAGNDVYIPGLIERSAEKMLVKMNEITGMYAKIGA